MADGAGCGSGGSAAERWADDDDDDNDDDDGIVEDEEEAVEASADDGDANFASAGAKSKLLLCGSGFGGDTHGTCTESETRFEDGEGSGISGGSSCSDGWSSL